MDPAMSSPQPHAQEATPSDDVAPTDVPSAMRRQAASSQRVVQPVLYCSDLLATDTPPRQGAPASHGAGDGGDVVTVGFRSRRRSSRDSERMRTEMLALVRSPLCWRPLVVFLFSLVVGATLAMAAYCFRGRRVVGTAIFRGNDTS